MSIKAVFFDLDGTLLPMDQDLFVKSYFGALAKAMAPLGYDPDKLVSAIWSGTRAMVANDGSSTNEQVFWRKFCDLFGENARKDEPVLDRFYRTDFVKTKAACGFAPEAAQAVRRVHERGMRAVLATNPIFPAIATQNRIAWAGLRPDDFELCTTYETCCHCKPNLDYYRYIMQSLSLAPQECAMVGNDVEEDMVAAELGMRVFLLTDCLISRSGSLPEGVPHGSFAQLMDFIDAL